MHPTLRVPLFHSVDRSNFNPSMVVFRYALSFQAYANEAVEKLGLIAWKHGGDPAWHVFTEEYKTSQLDTYTKSDRGIWESHMDRIQRNLPQPPKESNPMEEDSDDNSSISSGDTDESERFCMVEHIDVVMIDSYRVRSAAKLRGTDSASSIGGIRAAPMSAYGSVTGDISFGQSEIASDQGLPDDATHDSVSHIPGFPTTTSMDETWLPVDQLPHLHSTSSWLTQLQEPPDTYQDSFDEIFDMWHSRVVDTLWTDMPTESKKAATWNILEYMAVPGGPSKMSQLLDNTPPTFATLFHAYFQTRTSTERFEPISDNSEPPKPVLYLLPPEFPHAAVEEFAQETELWERLSEPERAMLGSFLYEAWASLLIAKRGTTFAAFAMIVTETGWETIRFLALCIHEERQHMLAHRAVTQKPEPKETYHLVSHKDIFRAYIDTPTEDLNQHPDIVKFEGPFSQWWQRHDTTNESGHPDAEVQKHTLFSIYQQLRRKGFEVCQSMETFMGLHSDTAFWHILHHWSTRVDDRDYARVPFPRVVVPMCPPDQELYQSIQQLVSGCTPLQQTAGILSKDLLPECLYVHVNGEADQLDRTKVLLEEMTEETAVDFIRKIQNNILKQQFPSPIPAMEEARK
jgi:hypothetical protein